MTASLQVRSTTPADVPIIFEQICALAEYEKLRHEVTGSAIALEKHLFGDRSCIEAIVAELAGDPVGFALYFPSYSTMTLRPGIYLEDLFVQPTVRGKGVGKALLRTLAQQVIDRQWSRLSWSVLDWNAPAINFYQRINTKIYEDIRICRLTGEALAQIAAHTPARSATVVDQKAVFDLIEANNLADSGSFDVQPELLAPYLFGDRPFAEAIVIEQDGEAAGLALFYTNYSTFLTQPGLYIEDLFVWPQFRGRGLGTALLATVARQAIDRDCGRVEWGVRTWNHDAIRLYERIGAVVMTDWRLCNLNEIAVKQLAA